MELGELMGDIVVVVVVNCVLLLYIQIYGCFWVSFWLCCGVSENMYMVRS